MSRANKQSRNNAAPNQGRGRPKGSPNKVTKETRAFFKALVQRNHRYMDKWLREVAKKDPAKAFELILRAAEYTTPKVQRIELPIGGGPEEGGEGDSEGVLVIRRVPRSLGTKNAD